jgi:hypothetical protein
MGSHQITGQLWAHEGTGRRLLNLPRVSLLKGHQRYSQSYQLYALPNVQFNVQLVLQSVVSKFPTNSIFVGCENTARIHIFVSWKSWAHCTCLESKRISIGQHSLLPLVRQVGCKSIGKKLLVINHSNWSYLSFWAYYSKTDHFIRSSCMLPTWIHHFHSAFQFKNGPCRFDCTGCPS